MRKFYFLVLIISFILSLSIRANLFSQIGDNSSPLKMAVIPPSPEASSLGKYGEIPVGFYTGIPTISIPIAELKGRRLSTSIVLGYHASGIKVEEVASRVGLGWSLQASGSITRVVRGLPDDKAGQGWLEPGVSGPTAIAAMPLAQRDLFLRYVAKGDVDVEPDVFNYNFNGMSGKFVLDKSGNISSMPHEKLKIALVKNLSTIIGFVVTDTQGRLYYFGKSQDGARTATDFVHNSSGCDGALPTFLDYNSTWHLLDIVEGNLEDAIRFEYETYATNTCNNSTESRYVPASKAPTTCYNITDLSGYRIKNILTTLNKMEFGYFTSRLDYPGDSRLDQITLKDHSLNLIKTYIFSYDYFLAGTGLLANQYCGTIAADARLKRLKLLSIQERGSDNSTLIPPYVFGYDTQSLPERFSFQQDHWGYFNNMPQNDIDGTLVPATHFLNGSTHVYLKGANRSPDSTAVKACTLTKIKYPTGGMTTFDYEIHTAENPLLPYPIKKNYTTNLVGNGVATSFNSANFTIQMAMDSGAFVTPIINNLTCDLTTLSCGIALTIKGVTNPSFSVSVTSTTTSYFLKNGTYRLEASIFSLNDNNKYFQYSASWEAEVLLTNKIVGGLRIKRITTTDAFGGPPIIKRYKYHFGNKTSGRVSGFIKFAYTTTEAGSPPVSYFARSSVSKASLATTYGSYVGYGRVEELMGENGENGKSIYYFTSPGTNPTQVFDYPFVPPFDNEWLQGLLQQQITYKKVANSFFKIDRKTTQYNDYIPATSDIDIFGAIVESGITPNHPTYQLYSNQTGKMLPAITTSTSYSYDLNNVLKDSLVTQTINSYDNPLHLQLTKAQVQDSRGKTLLTSTKFAHDLNQTDPAINQLVSSNMISLPQETTLFVNGLVVKGMKKEYSLQSGKIRLRNIYEAETVPPATVWSWTKKGTFTNYDAFGNALEIQLDKNSTTSYLWAYNNSLPIAEIKNATSNLTFYSGFEEGVEGNSTDAKVGLKCHTGSYAMTLNNLKPGPYVLSYWQKTAGSWSYVRQPVAITGTTYTFPFGSQPATFQIDELRFYPAVSELTSYTYNTAHMVTSATDANGKTVYYEYDALNRLTIIKDDKGKIVKQNKYNYKINTGIIE
jgi:YD repeat-containing protein